MAATNVQCTSAFIRLCGCDKSVRDVGYITKVARLRAITDNREGLAIRQLRQEYSKYGAVRSGCTRTRTVYIKEAQREGGKLVQVRPMQHQFLAHVLG